jgi:hypothetical protein
VGSGDPGCQPHEPALITCISNDCSLRLRASGLREPARPSSVLVDPSVPRSSLGWGRLHSLSLRCNLSCSHFKWAERGVGSLHSNKVHALFCLEINLKGTKYSSLRWFYMSTPLRASSIISKKYFLECIRIGTSLKILNPKRWYYPNSSQYFFQKSNELLFSQPTIPTWGLLFTKLHSKEMSTRFYFCPLPRIQTIRCTDAEKRAPASPPARCVNHPRNCSASAYVWYHMQVVLGAWPVGRLRKFAR